MLMAYVWGDFLDTKRVPTIAVLRCPAAMEKKGHPFLAG